MTGEVNNLKNKSARLLGEINSLRLENTRLNSEIARLHRGQKSGNSQTDLNYVMKRANCLLWHASIRASDDPTFLEWNVRPVRPDWAQSFFSLDLNKDEGYWEAFYKARIEEDLEPAGQRNAASIRAGLDYESEYRAVDSAGKVRWIHESVRIETEVPSQVWRAVGFCTDITTHKEMQEETRRLNTEAEKRATILGAARQVALDILRSRSGAEVLRHIADAARKLGGAEYAAIAIENAGEMDLPPIIAGGLTAADDRRPSPPWLTAECLDSIRKHPSEVWNSSCTTVSSSVDSSVAADSYLQLPEVTGPVLGIPIVRDGKALGALFICGAPNGRKFDDAAEAAVVTLADYAAVAIHFQELLKQQRVLTHSFVNLLEEERRSVAYELHDGVTQHIMAASAFLDSYCGNNDMPVNADREKGLMCLRLAVHESRRLINGLRALTLDEIGLERSIQQLLDEQAELAGWSDICFEHNTHDRRYGVELETAVYRIAQEALSNARKHASTDRISIRLNENISNRGSQLLTLIVQDWGNGFDPSGVTTTYGHVGLQSMLERTRLLKGEFRTESTAGSGTIVSAIFDLTI